MGLELKPMAYWFRGLGTTVQDFAAAIARFEGTCPSPDNCRNNNPGNLRAGPRAIGTDSRGIAVYPDYASGEADLERQISLNVGRGLNTDQFFGGAPGVYAGYAPAADANDPSGYASTVAGWLGIDPATPLSSIFGENAPGTDGSGAPVATLDTWAMSWDTLSPVAMAGLGIAGIVLLTALVSD